jgi:hypothetical protein
MSSLLTLFHNQGRGRPIGGISSQTYTEYINSFGPIAYWPMDEVPASQEYLTFDGADTKVDCGSGASLDDLQDDILCFDGWIKADGYGESNIGIIIEKQSGGFATTTGWAFRTESTGGLRATIKCATTDAVSAVGTDDFTADGAWHHICMVFNDAGDRKIYISIDGVWAASYGAQQAGVDAIVSDAANDLLIGNNPATTQTFDGSMGWLRLSDNDRYDGLNETGFTAPARTTIPTVDANTVALWPMNEGYGTVAGDIGANNNDGTITDGDWGAYPAADNAEGTAARDGAYTGVTLGQVQAPFTCPLFDGVNDYNLIGTASLVSAFNGAEGTLNAWFKITTSVWEDGASHYIAHVYSNGNNWYALYKHPTNNRVVMYRKAGGTESLVLDTVARTENWHMITITWSETSDAVKAYFDGAQAGSTQTGLGTWSGSLNASQTFIGSGYDTTVVMDGYLAHAAIFDKVLTAAQILDIYNAAGV